MQRPSRRKDSVMESISYYKSTRHRREKLTSSIQAEHDKNYIDSSSIHPITISITIQSLLPSFKTIIFVSMLAILIFISFDCKNMVSGARYKRCFTCRSRGALGDCRDPFTLNSTTFDGQSTTSTNPSIEAIPCASGWCAKTIEDNFADSLVATERSCMTRPPTDNEERCSETIFENQRDRKVFLCMCYGDLCNAATSVVHMQHSYLSLMMILSCLFCYILLRLFIHRLF